MKKMKIVALLIALIVPASLFAHAGHGISGNEILHMMMSHYYLFIIVAVIALVSRRAYLVRSKKK